MWCYVHGCPDSVCERQHGGRLPPPIPPVRALLICPLCGKPAGRRQQWELEDGRVICHDCAVGEDTARTASEIFHLRRESARRWNTVWLVLGLVLLAVLLWLLFLKPASDALREEGERGKRIMEKRFR